MNSLGSAEWKEIGTIAVRKIGEMTGYNINPMFSQSWKDVLKNTRKGHVDFVFLPTGIYSKLVENGAHIKPVVSLTSGEKAKICLYVNPTKNIKKIGDLNGKKIAAGTSWIKTMTDFPSKDPDEQYFQQYFFIQDFIFLRQFLNKAGIKTFRELGALFTIDYPNGDSRLLALDRGMIAATISMDNEPEMYRLNGRPLKNVQPMACSDETYFSLIAATGRVPQAAVDKVRTAFLDYTKTPDEETQEIINRVHLEVGKAGFVPVNENDLKPVCDILKAQEKNGGIAEATEIVEELIAAAKKKEARKK